jgi:hypothetical protein
MDAIVFVVVTHGLVRVYSRREKSRTFAGITSIIYLVEVVTSMAKFVEGVTLIRHI